MCMLRSSLTPKLSRRFFTSTALRRPMSMSFTDCSPTTCSSSFSSSKLSSAPPPSAAPGDLPPPPLPPPALPPPTGRSSYSLFDERRCGAPGGGAPMGRPGPRSIAPAPKSPKSTNSASSMGMYRPWPAVHRK